MPRKRFNAFDDFPVVPEDQPAQPAPEPATPTPQALFHPPHVLAEPTPPEVERIERLKPSQMLPDRFQPRRLLPTQIRPAFYAGQIDCYQAAKQWLQLAKNDEGMQAQVDRLLKMGFSFEEHGQIKPITGAWVEAKNGEYIFQIETGERRFWAACLQTTAHGLKEEPYLRVEVVSNPTRMRQVLENRHAEPPSAVGQACEVASLILAEMNLVPSGTEADEFEFFRRARAQRMPPGLWEKIMPVMDLTRPRLVQLLNILDLPTPLLDQADRYRVPERVLRAVLSAPRAQWEQLINTSIRQNLTSDDVAALTQPARPTPEKRDAAQPDPAQLAMNALKRFAHAFAGLEDDIQEAVLDELANDFVIGNQADGLILALAALNERMRIRQMAKRRGKA